MNKSNLSIVILLTLILNITIGACNSSEAETPTILINYEYLKQSKINIEKGDTILKAAFDKLIERADKALEEGPFSVTHKETLPPSGNKQDYISYSRYWWPDPNKKDGLPYIRKDGETNPDSQSPKKSDRPRIGSFGENTETLGLAYYLTGNQKYAKKAAELLRVWFLEEATKMNPNLNQAQCRLGHNNGTKSGVLDGRLMIRALEGALLIAGSSELSKSEMNSLKAWTNKYYKWLTTNEMALDEAASNNNHGCYYDVQVLYLALFSENYEAAKNVAQKFLSDRVYLQIEPDGSMPKEIARTRPLFCSIYNLHAMFLVAHLAQKVEVDIWEANEKYSRLKSALDYIVPYVDSNKKWPSPTIGEADRMDFYTILKMAYIIYPSKNYSQKINELPLEKRKTDIANLAFPVMR